MGSTIFHHWLDQFHALPEPRRRWIRHALVTIGIAVVFAFGVAAGSGFGLPNGLQARAHRLATQNTALRGRVQGLQQQLQTDSTALAALKQSLSNRDSELQKLKQEQTFYAKLIGIDGDRSGLGVHSITLSPVSGTDAWNFMATLVDTAENANTARGRLTLAVEGIRNGKLVTLDWANLAGSNLKKGVPFAFKFFQQVRGSFVLPKGFVPNRVTIILKPERAAAITRRLDWSEALAGHEGGSTTP
ncbi:MAG TPA: DUF6776 family protein [Rhodanobacteraceae bacterium]|nr:DUF6776 family protein [Rhodanobacteraceae bacterium]